MSPGRLDLDVVRAKLETVASMLRGIESLPLASYRDFAADPRMVAAGESFLRRALEALLDLGRHLLAKGFGIAAAEFKDIPRRLREEGVIDFSQAELLTRMAGYRNRLVHEYEKVEAPELYDILCHKRADLVTLADLLRTWVQGHASRLEGGE